MFPSLVNFCTIDWSHSQNQKFPTDCDSEAMSLSFCDPLHKEVLIVFLPCPLLPDNWMLNSAHTGSTSGLMLPFRVSKSEQMSDHVEIS